MESVPSRSRFPSRILRAAPALALMLLLACGRGPSAPDHDSDDIENALSGKTLTNETGARITLTRRGTIEGTGIRGTWWVSGNQVCRTLVAPERLAGTTCQPVVLADGRVAFQGQNGRILSFRIED